MAYHNLEPFGDDWQHTQQMTWAVFQSQSRRRVDAKPFRPRFELSEELTDEQLEHKFRAAFQRIARQQKRAEKGQRRIEPDLPS